tara:strand:+ start:196 stop:378 length:183 start_codon:yes stop_codon:yes gene_type:complete
MVKTKAKANTTKKATKKAPANKWWFEDVGDNVMKNAEEISANIRANADRIANNVRALMER